MPAPAPVVKKILDIKHQLLRPALTSHFQFWFYPPQTVKNWASKKEEAGAGASYNAELFSLLCCEASLPGSSLATIDIDNDYHGVSQKNVYRRAYDDRIDFTFYVDHNDNNSHTVIQFFENWISYTVNEEFADTDGRPGITKINYNYRVNYPKTYKCSEVYIQKFERDSKGRSLIYQLIEAFPISINSMPVSYESSELLKCTVAFNYERYLVTTKYLVTTNPNLSTSNPLSGSFTDPNNQLSQATERALNPSFGPGFGDPGLDTRARAALGI